jgi:predicted transcriptional regulator of viral defense system
MKGYQELAQKIIFHFDDALKIFKNSPATYGALRRLSKQGLIKKVRNNLYVTINPVTGLAFASKYQIGSSIHNDAFISHLSALEYYGYRHQVSRICFVSSSHRFNSFEFEDITYRPYLSKYRDGVVTPPYTELINVSDIERTVIDSIHSIDAYVNLETLIESLELIPALNQEKLLHYLNGYQIQALHQKTGVIMSFLKSNLSLKKSFFEHLKRQLKQGVTYLDHQAKKDGAYNKDFQIVVPKWLLNR